MNYDTNRTSSSLLPCFSVRCIILYWVWCTSQEWALKRVLAAHVHMCPANEWQFAFTASIFTAHTLTQVFFCCDYFFCLAYMCRNFPMNFKLCEFLSRRRFLADESYILINLPPSTYAAQSSSPLSWALGSEQEVTQALLRHSSSVPPLLPLPPAPLLEGTKPLADKTVQSDSNRCEKCVVIVSPSWLLLVTVFFWNFTILQRECVQSNHVTISNMLSPLFSSLIFFSV